MKYLVGVSFIALFACAEAPTVQAQQSTVITTCGTATIGAGTTSSGTYIDHTGDLCTNATGGGGGGGAVYGPTANGSPAANPPILVGGTVDGTATGTVQNAKVDASGNVAVTVAGVSTAANQATANSALAAIQTSTATTATNSALPVPACGATPCTTQIGNIAEVPMTAGGLTVSTFEPAASDNHTNLKNGAGQVYWITAFNNSATINYLRLYNAATGFNGCNSATNLVAVVHIPGNTSDAGFVLSVPTGLPFSTGISYCVVSAYGQTTTTNATASAMDINIGYK